MALGQQKKATAKHNPACDCLVALWPRGQEYYFCSLLNEALLLVLKYYILLPQHTRRSHDIEALIKWKLWLCQLAELCDQIRSWKQSITVLSFNLSEAVFRHEFWRMSSLSLEFAGESRWGSSMQEGGRIIWILQQKSPVFLLQHIDTSIGPFQRKFLNLIFQSWHLR